MPPSEGASQAGSNLVTARHLPFSLFVRLSVRQALAVPSATSHFCLSAALIALR